MTAVLYTPHFVQFFDTRGTGGGPVLPLSGGKLYTYAAGTTTPKATYTTSAATTQMANPIILDQNGAATFFIQGSYKFRLETSDGVLVEETDNITSFTANTELNQGFFQSFSGTGSQTVFTLSDNLGTDEKALMVFVDAGAGKGYEIQNPSAYTVDGTGLTFASAPASGTNNIYVFAPYTLIGAAGAAQVAADSAIAAQAAAEAAQAAAETAEANAETAETNAEAAAASVTGLKSTSTTSLSIGTGGKSFTTQSGKGFVAGMYVLATSDADPTNYMHGYVSSYSSATLILVATNTGGSGTHADWTITISGTRGTQGPTGSISDFSGVASATPEANDLFIFSDDSDSGASKTVTLTDLTTAIGGGLVYLGSQTASASSSLDFANIFTSTYDEYIFIGTNLIPATSTDIMAMRTSTNGGSSYDSTNGDYVWNMQSQSGTGTVQITDGATLGSPYASYIFITQAVNNAAPGASFYVKVSNPLGAQRCLIKSDGVCYSSTPSITQFSIAGYRNATTDVDSVRFFGPLGNITSGTIRAYGVKKS